MSVLFQRREPDPQPWTEAIRRDGSRMPTVTAAAAMRHSAVWAATRVRADIVSSLPVDLYRMQGGVQVEVTKPKVLVTPGALTLGGPLVDVAEWLYATQVDLDRAGNAVGLVVERDGALRPSRIDLCPIETVKVRQRGAEPLQYWIDGKKYEQADVWHERQYVVPGLPIGLSPIANAAMAISAYATAQEFAVAWLNGESTPKGILKNIKKELQPGEAKTIKERFKEAVKGGDVFVTGNDWEWSLEQLVTAQAEFITAQEFSVTDLCRFMGLPADMIDATTGKSAITYANITQRMLQFLIVNMGPIAGRRERALSKLTPMPQFVKLNTDALLRMDPLSTAQVIAAEIDARTLTNPEARGLRNRPALTAEDIAVFKEIYGDPNKQPTQPGGTK